MDTNTEMRRQQIDHGVHAPVEILAVIRGYDRGLDLRWDGREQTWGLWRKSELGCEVFVCTVGPRIDGSLIQRLRDQDTRRDGWSEEYLKGMKEGRRLAKAAMAERSAVMNERLAHAMAADSLEVQAQRAKEALREAAREG